MRTMSVGRCFHVDCTNRNSFGYCNTTVCINDDYRYEECMRILAQRKSVDTKTKPQTNADRIRAMSDEELAHALKMTAKGGVIGQRSEKDWLDWLKLEAGE